MALGRCTPAEGRGSIPLPRCGAMRTPTNGGWCGQGAPFDRGDERAVLKASTSQWATNRPKWRQSVLLRRDAHMPRRSPRPGALFRAVCILGAHAGPYPPLLGPEMGFGPGRRCGRPLAPLQTQHHWGEGEAAPPRAPFNNSAPRRGGGGSHTTHPFPLDPPLFKDWAKLSSGLRPIKKFLRRLWSL